jgi:hypothetical protein
MLLFFYKLNQSWKCENNVKGKSKEKDNKLQLGKPSSDAQWGSFSFRSLHYTPYWRSRRLCLCWPSSRSIVRSRFLVHYSTFGVRRRTVRDAAGGPVDDGGGGGQLLLLPPCGRVLSLPQRTLFWEFKRFKFLLKLYKKILIFLSVPII